MADSKLCIACGTTLTADAAFCAACGSPIGVGPSIERRSGAFYRAVTGYWPRIAVGIAALAAIFEFAIGSLSVGWSVEFYILAWATTTGGVWFLFDKAERTLSDDVRANVVGWLRATDSTREAFRSIPDQFALMFDRVFGEKHLSWKCFLRSSLASIVSVVVVGSLTGANQFLTEVLGGSLVGWVFVVPLSALVNTVPDYLSLLESRWAIKLAQRSGRLLRVLTLDLFLTAMISSLLVSAVFFALLGSFPSILTGSPLVTIMLLVMFLSAFFTSVWLWLYIAATLLALTLVRMSDGVGFLIRMTDLERQPFRSIGFATVVITTALFFAGLPLVLL